MILKNSEVKYIFRVNPKFLWKNLHIFPKDLLKVTSGGNVKATLGEIGFVFDENLPINTIQYDIQHIN